MSTINYVEYFREEKPIYVQNISGCQVSVTFEVTPGHSEPYLFTHSKDPVDLTQRFPFSAIKNSMDLRKMLNRVPSTLRLLSDDEFREFYKVKANQAGKTMEEVITDAEVKRNTVQNHQITAPSAPDESDDTIKKVAETAVLEEDVINSRVLNLMLQVHSSIPDQSKMSAQQLLQELDDISSNLTQNDWAYVQSMGYYKSVKNMAAKKVAAMATAELDDDKPKKTTKKK